MHSVDENEQLPESKLTGDARNLPEVLSFGSFDLYSYWVKVSKQHCLAMVISGLILLLVILFVVVNLL